VQSNSSKLKVRQSRGGVDNVLSLVFVQAMEVFYKIGRDTWGTVEHPYKTWKNLARERDWRPVIVLLLFFSGYFWIRVPIREGWPSSLLSWGFKGFKGAVLFGVMYVVVTGVFWLVGKWRTPRRQGYGGQEGSGDYLAIFSSWGYSYIPSAIWFGVTAGAFYLLPPPRSESGMGYLFSGVFVAMTVGLLMWKGLLYYLTMRLAVGLRPKEIGWVSVLVMVVLGVLGGWGYGMGWWRVPFI
jgi:hypothetical protein